MMPPSLFFSHDDLTLARENADREPVQSALAMLDSSPEEPLARAQILALRNVWHNDAKDGENALAILRAIEAGDSGLRALQVALGKLSALAMLRDVAGCDEAIDNAISHLPQADEDDALCGYWAAAVGMAVGCLQDGESDILAAAEVYRRAIDEHVHPEGYIRGIVDMEHGGDGRHSYSRQLSATCALALIAEMTGRRGHDLWSHEKRAVSIHTAAAYTHYYYFYPERWRWGDGLTREHTSTAMRNEGAFFELVNRRQPPRGIDALFAERRPMFCAHGGGLTTLTHGAPRPQRRRWKLW